MRSDKEGWEYKDCEICGMGRGPDTDHSECAKIKQKKYAGVNNRNSPHKTRRVKDLDSMALIYRDK